MDEVTIAIKQYVSVVTVLDLEEVGDDGVACGFSPSVFLNKDDLVTRDRPANDLAKFR